MPLSQKYLLPPGYSIDLESTKIWIGANHSSLFFQICFTLLFFLWAKPIVDSLHIPLFPLVIWPIAALALALLIYKHYQYVQRNKCELTWMWVVKKGRSLCGFVICEDFIDYSVISKLTVLTKHQRKGIGSVLIDSCIDRTDKPVYLFCNSKLRGFYQKFGFKEVDRYKESKSSLRQFLNFNVYMMVFKNH